MSYQLEVGRDAFADASRRLAKIARSGGQADVMLSLEQSQLLISVPGSTVAVDATGSWPGRVKVNGAALLSLAQKLAGVGDLTISVTNGRLRLGGISLSCAVDERPPPSIDLPVNASVGEIVHVALTHSLDEIERAGLHTTVTGALQRRDMLIEKAAGILRPLDVDAGFLRSAIDDELRRRYGS